MPIFSATMYQIQFRNSTPVPVSALRVSILVAQF